jgi:predicted dehydrogenase
VSLAHSHAQSRFEEIRGSDEVKLVGVAEDSPAFLEVRVKRIKGGIPADLLYTDYRKMIDQTKPDIVWACTETSRHVDVVRYCAPRGIHVMVEKPLAASYEQALEIQRLARRHGIQVLTNYGRTWWAWNYAVKTAVDSGAIGPIYRLRAVAGHAGFGDPKKNPSMAWFADPVENGGGSLMDFGCYSVVWSLWLKGRPQSVYATANHLKPDWYPNVEDNATLILNYTDGVGIFEASWDLPPRPPSGNEVFGRTGSIVVSGEGSRAKVELRKATPRSPGQRVNPIELKVDPLPPERSGPIPYLVDRLRNKQPVEGMSALDLNVTVLEVLDAAKLSIKTGPAIPLPLK